MKQCTDKSPSTGVKIGTCSKNNTSICIFKFLGWKINRKITIFNKIMTISAKNKSQNELFFVFACRLAF